MTPERWHIRSLRRFEDGEIAMAIYFCLGGIFSLIYTVAAIWQTHLYAYILSPRILNDYMIVLRVAGHIIYHAILRVPLWLPDVFWRVLAEGQSFLDWLLAADILKGMA